MCKGQGGVEVRECSRLSDMMCKGKAESVIIYLVSTEANVDGMEWASERDVRIEKEKVCGQIMMTYTHCGGFKCLLRLTNMSEIWKITLLWL